IAITGVEHIRASQTVYAFHVFDGVEYLSEMPAWNGAVHAIVIGRNPACGREGIFTTSPEAQTLFLRCGYLQTGSARLRKHSLHAVDFIGNFFESAVGFAQ